MRSNRGMDLYSIHANACEKVPQLPPPNDYDMNCSYFALRYEVLNYLWRFRLRYADLGSLAASRKSLYGVMCAPSPRGISSNPSSRYYRSLAADLDSSQNAPYQHPSSLKPWPTIYKKTNVRSTKVCSRRSQMLLKRPKTPTSRKWR